MITERHAMDVVAGDTISLPYEGTWQVESVAISREHRVTMRLVRGHHHRSYHRSSSEHHFIESRLYADHTPLDAIARLRQVGEATLSADLLAIETRHADELRAFRRRLEQRQLNQDEWDRSQVQR